MGYKGYREREGLTAPAQSQKKDNGDTPTDAEVTAPAGNADVSTTNQPTGVPNGQPAAVPTTPANDASTGPNKDSGNRQKKGLTVGDGVSPAAPLAADGKLPYTPTAKTDAEVEATHNRLMQEDQKYGLNYAINTILQQANGKKPETEAEREAREKKEKRQKVWAAVGDGLAALSNLYFTTKGAPSMYGNKGAGMQDALQTRIDKDKADRDAREKEYNGYMAQLAKLYMERGKTVADMQAAAEARKQAREKAEREQERHNWEKLGQPAKQAEADAKAKTAQEEAKYAETYYSNRANRVGASSGSSVFTAKYPVFGPDGKVIRRVYSRDEAISETEREGGTWPSDVVETEYEKNDPIMGKTTGKRSTVKKTVKAEKKEDDGPGDEDDKDIRSSVKNNKTMPGIKNK